MTRAEEAALKAYPVVRQSGGLDVNRIRRKRYQEGYEKAEEELTLTWKDIKDIDEWIGVILTNENVEDQELYEKVLRRFNESKRETLVELLMKDAVEGHCFVSPANPSVLFVQTEPFENKKGFRYGETCKVIVLKNL